MTAYGVQEAREIVLKAGLELVKRKLIVRTWGNISARISDTQFVITPSGKAYNTLRPEDIVIVNTADGSYEGSVKPSSEKMVHAMIYRQRRDVNFVIHTHQNAASALSVCGKHLPLAHAASAGERRILGEFIPCAEYGMSSTQRLAENVAGTAKDFPESAAILMRCHGAVCMGGDYESAFLAADTLERVSGRIYRKLYGEPDYLPAEQKIIQNTRLGCCIHVRSPFIMEVSRRGKTMYPYLDDLAMIAGTSVKCASQRPTWHEVRKKLGNGSAVFLKNDGALCFARTEEEAEAVSLVLEKGCMAACLGMDRNIPPVSPICAAFERRTYVKSYSKLK